MARRRRKKKSPKAVQKKGTSHRGPLIGIGLFFVAIMLVLFYAAENRSWQEYIDAGDRAYERGNYPWAEKMYREALQYAEQKGKKDPLVAKTWRHLKRLERARSRAMP